MQNQSLEKQLQHHNISDSIRTLQKDLKQRKRSADMYRQVNVKGISQKNKEAQVDYEELHKDNTVNFF